MQGIEKITIKGSWEEEVEWNQGRVDANLKGVYILYWRKWVKIIFPFGHYRVLSRVPCAIL